MLSVKGFSKWKALLHEIAVTSSVKKGQNGIWEYKHRGLVRIPRALWKYSPNMEPKDTMVQISTVWKSLNFFGVPLYTLNLKKSRNPSQEYFLYGGSKNLPLQGKTLIMHLIFSLENLLSKMFKRGDLFTYCLQL